MPSGALYAFEVLETVVFYGAQFVPPRVMSQLVRVLSSPAEAVETIHYGVAVSRAWVEAYWCYQYRVVCRRFQAESRSLSLPVGASIAYTGSSVSESRQTISSLST